MGRDFAPAIITPCKFISIHAPAWGATGDILSMAQALAISIHAPAWGATTLILRATTITLFQFTHPHGARLTVKLGINGAITISIHAPAWGATKITKL